MKSRILPTLLICGLMIFGSTAFASAKDITIGMAVAFSGWMEAYDGEAAKMAQLWIEQKNAHGGLLGEQIKVVTGDTKTDRVEGAKVGQALIGQGANLLLVSADYDYGAPAALQAQKAGVISTFLGASDPKAGIIGVGPLSFTANNAAQLEGAVMGQWGYDKKGFRKGYMLIDETIEYNKSICAGYDWAFPKKGGTVVGQDTFKGIDPTISSQITRLSDAIRTSKVDNIMLCSTNPGAASAVRQLRAAGITLPIMSGTAMDGTYWLNSTPGLKDFYLPVQALDGERSPPRGECDHRCLHQEIRQAADHAVRLPDLRFPRAVGQGGDRGRHDGRRQGRRPVEQGRQCTDGSRAAHLHTETAYTDQHADVRRLLCRQQGDAGAGVADQGDHSERRSLSPQEVTFDDQ